MEAFDPALALLAGLTLAAMISASGALLFRATVIRRTGEAAGAVTRLIRLSLALALILGGAWTWLGAAAIAGTSGWADTLAALPLVIRETRFGTVQTAHAVLVLAALVLVTRDRGRDAPAMVASFASLALQPLISHAAANGDWALAATESLHLLAAAAWLGGLLPLLLVTRHAPAPIALAAARRFTPTGLASVLVIAGTGFVQASALIGSPAALTATPYGEAALTKIALFAVLLVLALLNRLVFVGGLGLRRPQQGRRLLGAGIAAEIALGLAVVLTAAALASLPPPAEIASMNPP